MPEETFTVTFNVSKQKLMGIACQIVHRSNFARAAFRNDPEEPEKAPNPYEAIAQYYQLDVLLGQFFKYAPEDLMEELMDLVANSNEGK